MNIYRLLSIACLIACVACLAGFFGACASLVPGDSGGAHESGALVAAVIAGVFCIVFGRWAASGRRAR